MLGAIIRRDVAKDYFQPAMKTFWGPWTEEAFWGVHHLAAAFNRAVRSHIESKSNGAINKVSAYITTFFDDLNQCVTHFTQAAHSNGRLLIYQGLGN